MPLTKSAAIQKILEIQSQQNNLTDDIVGSHYDLGFKHGQILALMELFKINEEDFR